MYFADWTGSENGETSAIGPAGNLCSRHAILSARHFLTKQIHGFRRIVWGHLRGNCELNPEGAGIEGVKVAAFEEGFSLFAYALDQIGLRLEAQRALVEMLVDHVEKTPTEN